MLLDFAGVDVVIPLTVIEELDGLKTRLDDVGRAARTALRTIEELRVRAGGSLAEPGADRRRADGHGADRDQRHPASTCSSSTASTRPCPTTASSAPPSARRSTARPRWCPTTPRCASRPLTSASTPPSTARPAQPTTTVARSAGPRSRPPHESIDACTPAGSVAVDDVDDGVRAHGERVRRAARRLAVGARPAGSTTSSSLLSPHRARGLGAAAAHRRSSASRSSCCSTRTVSVVALDGRAGTGKTILAIAAGLEQVVEQRRYERLAIYRPLVPVGRADVGFLPGGLDEKLDPWMSAIHDADRRPHRPQQPRRPALIDELTTRGQLSLESVTFLRGRSLHRQIVVVDEAQNLEPTTLKTILTRIGEGTKVVFTGDTSQIDAPYLGESNNALAVLIQAFGGQRCFGHVTLTACERSDVASLAAELL